MWKRVSPGNGVLLLVLCLMAWAASPGQADEVFFKNGDHLTGKIETLEASKLTITTAVAGKVTVDLKDVRTFSSDAPLAMKLNDGTVIHQKVAAGPDGQVAIAPGGALQPQAVPISSIKSVNFKEDWTGTLTVGGELARGNTNTDTLHAGLNHVRRTEKDRITAGAGVLYEREKVPGTPGKHETENDWFIEGKYDYFFSPRFYGYANARVERDLIAGISLRLTPGVGVGYDWLDKPDLHFRTEGGVSWLYRDYSHDGSMESVALRLAYHVDKKFNDKVTFFHNLEYYPGLDSVSDYLFTTDAGVRTALTERMFSEFKIQEQYDSAPAPGKGRNDTRFVLNVGWTF
jgi:putative salt-induced outer membrane protein YdiY